MAYTEPAYDSYLFFFLSCSLVTCVAMQTNTSVTMPTNTTYGHNATTGFCNGYMWQQFDTECMSCAINAFTDCPSGAFLITPGEGTPGCHYVQTFGVGPNITRDGCTHTCNRTVELKQCCPGFWGPNCNECPGGATTPCNGHGTCDGLINGTGVCTCQEDWTGYSCELCSNSSLVAPNCTTVIDTSLCMNVSCSNHSHCTVIDKEPVCMCEWPYVDHNADNSTHCKEVDLCSVLPLCHANASCSQVHDPASSVVKNCTCVSGYHGDGYQCDPDDPCQVNYGGCDIQSTKCVSSAPGKSECVCLEGYHEFVPGVGCSLVDYCNKTTCHARASCQTIEAFTIKCTCLPGYTGNGKVCYGNILQTINDLNQLDDDLKGQLSYIYMAMNKYYKNELSFHAPFTVFLPSNEGFRSGSTANLKKWLENSVRVKQVLRQHIVVGEFTLEQLNNHTMFHTLQGMPAQLLMNRDVFRYRLQGSGRKAKVLRGNILASNGVVHVINKLMTTSPASKFYSKVTAFEYIKSDGKYNRLESLILAAGDEVTDLMTQDGVTLFTPSNAAFDQLHADSLDFIRLPEQKGTLVTLLKNHIFNGTIEIAALINKRRITSYAGINTAVSVTATGQVRLNGAASITQADIVVSNGLVLDVDMVLVPDGVSLLPNRCDKYTYKLVTGPCGDCRENLRCSSNDVATNDTVTCSYYVYNGHKYELRDGCALMCNRTYSDRQCCEGFYGFDCLPCPGGYKNPCSGHGKCDDGYFQDGTCLCDENFSGTTCQDCDKERYFGVNCSQAASSSNLNCFDWYLEASKMWTGDDLPPIEIYIGQNKNRYVMAYLCWRTIVGLNTDIRYLMQLPGHARCIIDAGFGHIKKLYRRSDCETLTDIECTCIKGSCKAGPQGDGTCAYCQYGMMGTNCDKQNRPCATYLYCHAHAQCVLTGQGDDQFSCICEPGYVGNGEQCVEIDPCQETSYGGCHTQASCIKTGPGKNNCSCNTGWTGDGTYCYPATSCSHTGSGSCHENATCIQTSPGQHICRCNDGYHGDGLSCVLTNMCSENNGNCHSKATCKPDGPGRVNCTCNQGYSGSGYSCYGDLITTINDHHNLSFIASILQRASLTDLGLMTNKNYTVFAPNDLAVVKFLASQGIHGHWHKTDSIITLLNYHMLLGATSLVKLVALSRVKRLETMEDGFFISVTEGPSNEIHVSSRKGLGPAKVVESDLIATNGYINIVDKVLEPYRPRDPDSYPDLDTFFQNHTQYSVFGKWLMEKNLMSYLESNLTSYTLFVPTNDAMATINRTVTTDFLKYYILTYMMMTASILNGNEVPTSLGWDHELQYKVYTWTNVTVNDVQIVEPDLFTFGGIVNGISGLLHPVLSVCDINTTYVEYGICAMCSGRAICPDGYKEYSGPGKIPRFQNCTYRHRDLIDMQTHVKQGCQGLCVIYKQRKGCCSGHFGASCEECPSGPESPCNGHGRCDDGLQGTGTCTCQGRFTGDTCAECITGWTGPQCDIDMSGCDYRNGGCPDNAVCIQNSTGAVSCKCAPGYRGDGYNCSGPCDVNNGGCHSNATCLYKVSQGITCTCQSGLVGDGKSTCNADIITTLSSIPEASIFLKSLKLYTSGGSLASLVNNSSKDHLQFTVFVPENDNIGNKVLQKGWILQQVVLANSTVRLDSGAATLQNVTSISGDTVNISYIPTNNVFFVNDSKVLQGNIVCTDGIVHLLDRPFNSMSSSAPAPTDQSGGTSVVVPIVVSVVVVLLVATGALVAFVVYRRSHTGYWALLQKWRRPNSQTSDTMDPSAPLHFNDASETVSGLPGNTNFGNPLYSERDLE